MDVVDGCFVYMLYIGVVGGFLGGCCEYMLWVNVVYIWCGWMSWVDVVHG